MFQTLRSKKTPEVMLSNFAISSLEKVNFAFEAISHCWKWSHFPSSGPLVFLVFVLQPRVLI